MLNKIVILLFVLSISVAFAQTTTQFTISWDANTEDDMSYYKIYKRPGNESFVFLSNITHPTTEYVDTDIIKGTTYSYRLKAVNDKEVESSFSAVASATIPKINLSDTIYIAKSSSINIDLNTQVTYPNPNSLSWTVSGNNVLTINKTNNSVTIISPDNWTTDEVLTFSVRDDSDFEDTKQVVFAFAENNAPLFSTIPDQEILADSELQIYLSNYVNDEDSRTDQLVFEFDPVDSINLQISDSILIINPISGFQGARTVTIHVTDNTGLEDETSFTLTVKAIDTPLTANITTVQALGSSLNLSWTTSISTIDFVEYGLTQAYENQTIKELNFSTIHSASLTNLIQDTTYFFRIVSEDQNGNVSFVIDSTFTTEGSGNTNENNVLVFPMPYREKDDLQKRGISFSRLPVNGKLLIYNLAGDPVYKEDDLQRRFDWPVTNNSEKRVSSGLYLYVVKDAKNKKVASGKIIVVR